MGSPALQRDVRTRDHDLRRAIGKAIRELREDAALTRSAIADAAGVDRSFVGRIETGAREPSLSTLVAIAAVLGADLSVRLYPTTGPRIRDRIQATMVETFLAALHRRWVAAPEVPVYRPARGVIDVVLSNARGPVVVASEFHSELRRLEQQIRWHREKEASLPSADIWPFISPDEPPATSRLLVLRSTRPMRELALTFEATLRAAYPARAGDALEALTTGSGAWPGAAILWVSVDGGTGRLLDGPPRGVRLGR
jgi:XRE family transcriptional regulator, regulator of sulfur utilization